MFKIILPLLMLGASANARLTAVIFDCDGVLVESERLKFESWREVLRPHHVDLSLVEYVPMVGFDNVKVLRTIAAAHHVSLTNAVIAEKEAAYKRRQSAGVPAIARGVALVKYLSAHRAELKIKLGLASGGLRSEIAENLRQTQLSDAFDQIISGSEDLAEFKDVEGTNKPKPYVYQKIARRLGVNPRDVVVFEDSGAGVEAAARAGMTVFAVPHAMTKDQDFTRAAAILKPAETVESIVARLRSAAR